LKESILLAIGLLGLIVLAVTLNHPNYYWLSFVAVLFVASALCRLRRIRRV
jgi:hypothetical protein